MNTGKKDQLIYDLIKDMTTVYKHWKDSGCQFHIPEEELNYLFAKILKDQKYVLSPLRILEIYNLIYYSYPNEYGNYSVEAYDYSIEADEYLKIHPDCMTDAIVCIKDRDKECVYLPANKRDALVMAGLGLLLFRISNRGIIPGYRHCSKLPYLKKTISEIGKVKRLYSLDLVTNLYTISNSLILEKVRKYVGESSIYKIIESFLHLPIIDKGGYIFMNTYAFHHMDFVTNDAGKPIFRQDIYRRWYKKHITDNKGIPLVGEITYSLLDIVLMDLFDREFKNRFPGIDFVRYLYQVFLFVKDDDSDVLDKNKFKELLIELNLKGEIKIDKDNKWMSISDYTMYVNNDGSVELLDEEERDLKFFRKKK